MKYISYLAIFVFMLVVSGTAIASQPRPLSFNTISFALGDPVEQQSPNFQLCDVGIEECQPETWVHNPTSCVWDVDDDHYRIGGFGYLGPGLSASGSVCIVSDYSGYLHAAIVDVSANTPNLNVSISDSFGNQWAVPPVANADGYRYWGCVVLDPQFESYPVIEGSNGGVGRIVTYAVTVSNPTSHRVRDIRASFVARTNLLVFGCTYYLEP